MGIAKASVALVLLYQLSTSAHAASRPACQQTVKPVQDEVDLYERSDADVPFLRIRKADLPAQICVLESQNGRYEIAWKGRVKVAWVLIYQFQGPPTPLTPATEPPRSTHAGSRLGKVQNLETFKFAATPSNPGPRIAPGAAQPSQGSSQREQEQQLSSAASTSTTLAASIEPPRASVALSPPASALRSAPKSAPQANTSLSLAAADRTARLKLIWPVQGPIVVPFGAHDARTNEGIDIAAPEGTPVKAAADGTVAYAGNELRGYGKSILLQHADGFVTAYAPAGELLVKTGDEVHQGEIIARVGSTGSITSPQLHFEVRKGSTPVDPIAFLQQAQ